MNSQNKKTKKGFDNFIRYSSLAFEMMAIIAGGTFGGWKLDQWMENDFKAFTLGLMIFSVIAAILYGTRNIMKKK
ncbi:MAG: AtpZ/AtpI family protein [Prolixibacteraceae bacterium]